MENHQNNAPPVNGGSLFVYSIKDWSLALVCPMVVTFSFFMAVLDPEQRQAFSDLATIAFTSSGTFVLSKRQTVSSPNQD